MYEPPAKYAAALPQVCEVTLQCTADLAFWTDRLRPEGVEPADHAGKARLLVGAFDSRYMGVRFRELIIAIFVQHQDQGERGDGMFLAHAFNSNRWFALIERKCFATPYYHGDIQVNARLPASFQVSQGNQVQLRAAMSPTPRTPVRNGQEEWHGPIFLPRHGQPPGKVFFGKIGGVTQAYPFLDNDAVALQASGCPALAWLRDSGCTGQEWLIRENGAHAKGKTTRRVRS